MPKKISISIILIFIAGLMFFLPNPPKTHGADCFNDSSYQTTDLIQTPTLSGFSTKSSSGACVIDPQKSPFIPYKLPTYDDLTSAYYNQKKSIPNILVKHDPLSNDRTDGDIGLTSSSDHLYYVNGNLNINSNIPGSQTGVIFVEGNLTINPSSKKLKTGNSTGLVFIVKGNVYIDPSVTEIDAIIISSGNIYTAGTTTCETSTVPVTQALTVNGSLITIGETSKVVFCRKIDSAIAEPAEIINHQPKYFVILRNIYSDTLQRWSEISSDTPTPSSPPTPLPTAAPPNTTPRITAGSSWVSPGGQITISWSNITNPSITDQIGFYLRTDTGNANPAVLFYTSNSSCSIPAGTAASANGSCNITIPSSTTPGNYEFRLLQDNITNYTSGQIDVSTNPLQVNPLIQILNTIISI